MKPVHLLHVVVLALLMIAGPQGVLSQGVSIGAGSKVVITGPVYLVLNNAGLNTNGGFSAGNSTVVFTGGNGAVSPIIGGSTVTTFYNVRINTASQDVFLKNNISVQHFLTMAGGNLQLNDHTLDLGYTGLIVGEGNASRVTDTGSGTIVLKANLMAPQAVNPGNLGITITSLANLGQTLIVRGHRQQLLSDGSFSIQRHFAISPALNENLNATLAFRYFDAELPAGIDEALLTVWSNAGSGSNWSMLGNDGSNAIFNWVTKNNVDHLTSYTLGETVPNQLSRIGNNSSRLKDTMPVTFSQFPAASLARIYPNPTNNLFNLALFSSSDNETVVSLYDGAGNLLKHKRVTCHAGMNYIGWDMNGYRAGVYYLVFENQAWNNIRIIKQ